MSATQAKLLWAAGMFAAAWLFREKKTPPATPSANVELGVPTVNGVLDAPYYSKRGTVAEPDDTGEDS